MTETAPPNATVISQLPVASSVNAGDNILTQRADKSLAQLPADLLKGQKGEAGQQGPAGKDGAPGKDATAPPLAIFPYYDDTPPDGYLFLYGQAFDPQKYPILAQKFPSNILPDFRNRVPRGSGDLIMLGEVQEDALQNIKGTIGSTRFGGIDQGTGAFAQVPSSAGVPSNLSGGWTSVCSFDASRIARTSDETRVKAIGVNFIIKAN